MNPKFGFFAIGCIAMALSLPAFSGEDSVVRRSAMNELAKLKRHQILQKPEIQEELSDIQSQIILLQSAVTSMNQPVINTKSVAPTQKKDVKTEKIRVSDSISTIAQTVQESRLMKEDPVFAHLLLSRLGALNNSLTQQQSSMSGVELQSSTADAEADLNVEIDGIAKLVNGAATL